MIFLVSSGKIIFLFPENMILFFRRKMKDDLSQKKYMEIWYILQMFRKDGLSKKIALEYDLSYIMRKDGISFSRKYDIFFTDKKWKMIFLKKYMEVWCFCMLVKVVFLFPINMKLPFCQKSKDDLIPKNTPKDAISGITEKDDIHPRKDDIGILCAFMEIFLSVFIYCFPIKKTPGNLIYRAEIWLYL